MMNIQPKWKLTLKVLPFVLAAVAAKSITHYYGWEFLSLSPLFTALISANIFLVGFLITGVISDYKESEKIPGELASSIETIADEFIIIAKTKKTKEAKECLTHCVAFAATVLDWTKKKAKTSEVMDKITGFNDCFIKVEGMTQPNFVARLKSEQHIIRKLVTRIHTIRETNFSEAAYAIAEIITMLLVLGFLFVKIEPYYESLFFLSFVSFILIYLLFLIRDLDNPFSYYEKESLTEEVSLYPIEYVKNRLESTAKTLD
jgi:predicted membrane chloride channel (bestrophin family)